MRPSLGYLMDGVSCWVFSSFLTFGVCLVSCLGFGSRLTGGVLRLAFGSFLTGASFRAAGLIVFGGAMSGSPSMVSPENVL